MLLFGFVAFIIFDIFCLRFSQKQSANQPKKYRGMVYYLIEQHMCKNSGTFEGKKITQKSHLRPSFTKPFKPFTIVQTNSRFIVHNNNMPLLLLLC